MPFEVCTRDTYITDGACFTGQYFSQHEQNAILVYRWAQWVDSLAGEATYAVSPFTLLWSETNAATCGMSSDQLDAAEIAVYNHAVPSSISILPTTAPYTALTQATAATAIPCLVLFSDLQLKAMKLYLQCVFFQILGF